MKIIVNVKELEFPGSQVSYEEIVVLASKSGKPTVTYRGPRRGDSQRSGIMHPGCKAVELDEGMIFSVMHTVNA